MFKTCWKAMVAVAILCGLSAASIQAQTVTWTDVDVGAPQYPGSVTKDDSTGIITQLGGGADIWGNPDQFNFYYRQIDGDFEAVIQVTDLQGPDGWSKAEFMAREGTDDGSGNLTTTGSDRHVNVLTTRAAGQNEVRLQYRNTNAGGGGEVAPSPVIRPAYPNTWLRLVRAGDIFTAYSGTDGTTWTTVGSVNTATWGGGGKMASKLMLGLATTAHNNTSATLATAKFKNLGVIIPPQIINVLPMNGANYQPPTGNFTFTVSSLVGVETSNVVVKLNDVNVSSKLTFSGDKFTRNVTLPGPFTANAFQRLTIALADNYSSTLR